MTKSTAWRILIALTVVALAPATEAHAQRAEVRPLPTRLDVGSGAPTGGASFLIEVAGAAVGSAAGSLTVYALAKDGCDVEDLRCVLAGVAGAGLASTAGAAVGAYVAGRSADTRPSLPGAIVGAALGSVAGFGMFHLLKEEINLVSGDFAAISTYVLTQSVLTALGSRIARALD